MVSLLPLYTYAMDRRNNMQMEDASAATAVSKHSDFYNQGQLVAEIVQQGSGHAGRDMYQGPVTIFNDPQPSRSDSDQCLHDLRVTDPRVDRMRILGEKDNLLIRECYAWILENDSFRQWGTHKASRLLWIKGDPGKGKTMMTMGVINELSRKEDRLSLWKTIRQLFGSKPCMVAYFFCQSTRPELNNAVSVLRGLVYMLVTEDPRMTEYVRQRYDAIGKQLFEGSNAVYELGQTLSDILKDPRLPPTVLVVDALDECTSGLSELLQIITNVSSLGQHSRTKWLVTSRNIQEIESHLQPDSAGMNISLEVNETSVKQAIATFIDHKVKRLVELKKYDPQLQAEVQQQLREKAEGTFLWVSLVCKELKTLPHNRTLEVLKALPPGLNPIYDRMMERIKKEEKATAEYCMSILRVAALVFRPLQLRVLAAAAGLPNDKFNSEETVLDLVRRCGSFLIARESVVSFIHLSAKDYFMIGNGHQLFDTTTTVEHGKLVERLLERMSNKLGRNMCNLDNPRKRIQEIVAAEVFKNSDLPQIEYACEHWVDHLEKGEQSCGQVLVDDGKVHSFFQEHLLYWLEVMSLLQKVPESISALQKLQSLLIGHDSAILYDAVRDALRFVMWCAPKIREVPLQVYDSALLFAPENSIVRRQFANQLPKNVRVNYGLDRDWGPLVQILEAHTGSADRVVFSSRGDRLASASSDCTVRLWNAETGHVLHTLEGHKDPVTNVAFSPQGELLATASADRTVCVWYTNTGQKWHHFQDHAGAATSITFSPQGNHLLSVFNDGTVRMWDLKDGKVVHIFEHSDACNSTALASQYNLLALALPDYTVRVYSIKRRERLYILRSHTDIVTNMVFSPRGDILATTSLDHTVRVWDTKTGQSISELKIGKYKATIFSPHGDFLAISDTSHVQIWNVGTRQTLHMLKSDVESNNSMVFSLQGDRLACAVSDHRVQVWDVEAGLMLHELSGHRATITSMTFSPQGTRLVTASSDYTLRVWDIKKGQAMHRLQGHTNCVNSVGFSPCGRLLASASSDGTVQLWNAKTEKVIDRLEGHQLSVTCVVFSPQGTQLASSSLDHTIRMWNVQTRQSEHTLFGHEGFVTSIVFSPQGNLLASASYDRTVRVWDIETGEVLHTLQGHKRFVTCVAFSPKGDLLASGSEDHTVRIWDANRWDSLRVLHGHKRSVTSVAFSSQHRLASASSDQTVRVWNTKTWESPRVLDEHTGAVNSVVFSPWGDLLATASLDRTVRVWNTRKWEAPRVLKGHSGGVTNTIFSPQGDRLASASIDSTVRLWDTKTKPTMSEFDDHTNSVDSIVLSPRGDYLAVCTRNIVRLLDASTGQPIHMPEEISVPLTSGFFSPDDDLVVTSSLSGEAQVWHMVTKQLLHQFSGDHIIREWLTPNRKLILECYDLHQRITSASWAAKSDGGKGPRLSMLPWLSMLPLQSMLLSSRVLRVSNLVPQPRQRFSIIDDWLVVDSQKMLWIPADYKPQCTAFCVNRAALGYKSGKVLLLEFS